MIVSGPPFVVVMLLLIVKLPPVNTIPEAPFVLIVPLEVKLLTELTAKEFNGVTSPKLPNKRIDPAVPAISVKLPGPSTVLEKVLLAPAGVPPAFVVSTVAFPVNVTAPLKPTAPPGVVSVDVPALNIVVPKFIADALITPRIVVVLAVLVKLFVNARLADEPLFSVTPPVLLKVVAGVTVPPLLNTTA